jgi:hypothetical protein
MNIVYLSVFSAVLALGSFGLSAYTFWLTKFHRGRLCMTRPTMVCMTREQPSNRPKIFLRSLLYSTSARGWVVESMYLRLHQRNWSYIFDIWVYGEAEKLSLGSGLFVSQTGAPYNHHFNLCRTEREFTWWDGDYRLEVFANLVGMKSAQKLTEINFNLGGEHMGEVVNFSDAGIFFEWDAATGKYRCHVERYPWIARPAL